MNKNPLALSLIKDNLDNIPYHYITGNPIASDIIIENIHKLDNFSWCLMGSNSNSDIINLLSTNIDKIDYCQLAKNTNPEILKIIEIAKDTISPTQWELLSASPHIFQLDYEIMKINNQDLEEELIKEVMKPSRVFKNPDYDYIEILFGD